MASLTRRPNGRYWIQFRDSDKKQQTLRLGKCSQRHAEKVKSVVEDLLSAKRLGGSPLDSSVEWLNKLEDDKLRDKLVHYGLTKPKEATRLQAFVERYIATRTDLKPRTLIKFNATLDYLIDHFGADRNIATITEGEAEDFRIYLLSKKTGKSSGETMGENTVRKHCQITKQFFNKAVKSKLIQSNPFAHLKATVQANKTRYFYIDQPTIDKVIEMAPDTEWKLIFALARFGGLRCPSEILELKWSDIDWAEEEMVVRSDKTEHHTGQDQRIVPIFSDLLPILRDAFEVINEGASDYVITRYRDSNSNLRTQAHRIIRRAGFTPWPKVFQNLRSSLATDLVQYEAIHVVAQWTGHTVETMRKFYLQVTKEHRENAKRREKKAKAKASKTARIQKDRKSSDEADPKAKAKAKASTSERGGKAETAGSEESLLSIRNSPCPILTEGEGSGGGTRTPDTRIMIPLL